MSLDVTEPTTARAGQSAGVPRVSIIIPSYNHERFVGRAIDSVLSQTYQDFEIVITDDASADGSVGILRSYADRDPRIKLFVNRYNYETHAVNHGIHHAAGEYIAVLSSDDEFHPAKLERQVDLLDRRPDVAAVFTQARLVDEQNRDLPELLNPFRTNPEPANRSRHAWLRRFFFNGNCLCHPSVLIRRSVYETLGVYNPLMGALDDLDLWVRICLRHEIHVLGDTLINFRIRDAQANVSADTPENFRRGQFETIKILDHFVSPDALAQLHLIFPEFADQSAGEPDDVKRHVLANAALATGMLGHRFWGIDLLYKLLSEPEARRHLRHRISRAPDVDFVKLNGALNPLSIEQRATSQVFWPEAGVYSEANSRSRFCQRSEWIELRLPVPAWDTATPLRFDPSDRPGVIKLAALAIYSQADDRCLWSVRPDANRAGLTVTGTAMRLSDPTTCSILSTGFDPQLLLWGIPPLPDLPLELRVWIKLEPGLESAASEIAALKAIIDERQATVQQLRSQLGEWQAAEREARLEAPAAAERDREAADLRAAVADRDREVAGLRAAVADRDREVARLHAAVTDRDRETARLHAAVAERDRETTRLHAAVAERDREAAARDAAIAERDRAIAVILGARSWRYTSPLRRLVRLMSGNRPKR